ncbi:MAG: aspartate kinase [Bacteroidales bacterium]
MIVHKFGGASVKDVESIKRIPKLLNSNETSEKVFIVISAMGKTTNKLEEIINAAYKGDDFEDLLFNLKTEHTNVLSQLINNKEVIDNLNNLFEECKIKVFETPKQNYSYFYDQIICYGERASSFIVYEYLKTLNFDIRHIQAKDLFYTDENYRAGNINLKLTQENIQKVISENKNQFFITQGFIGRTEKGDSISLGREGSDYSAGLVAYCANAKKLIFWKDVDGIYSADPKIFKNSTKISKISYEEMVELSYFGAKVLHEKTLFALREKNISLFVKSFLYPENEGTELCNNYNHIFNYPIIRILLKDQILFTVEPKQKQLIGLNHIEKIYNSAKESNVYINLIQISATRISFCADYHKFTCDDLLYKLNKFFHVKYNNDVTIITLRHYKQEDFKFYESEFNILLSQVNRSVAQFVIDTKEIEK